MELSVPRFYFLKKTIVETLNTDWGTNEFLPTNISVYHVKIPEGDGVHEAVAKVYRQIDESTLPVVQFDKDIRELLTSPVSYYIDVIVGTLLYSLLPSFCMLFHWLIMRLMKNADDCRSHNEGENDWKSDPMAL